MAKKELAKKAAVVKPATKEDKKAALLQNLFQKYLCFCQ